MLPPSPPSPPSGPPKGMARSRRKLTQPLPPSPASTRMLASSTNFIGSWPKIKAPAGAFILRLRALARDDVDEGSALRSAGAELNLAVGLGIDSVVLAQARVHAGVHLS